MFLVRTTETEIEISEATHFDVYNNVVIFQKKGSLNKLQSEEIGIYIPLHVITYMEYKKDAT